MVTIKYDSGGNVSGLPDSIRPGDDLTFEIIGKDVALIEDDDLRLALAFEKPQSVTAGEWVISYGGSDSEPVRCDEVSAYLLGLALNRIDTVISAGGVVVSGSGPVFTVNFLEVGVRTEITVSHSILGDIAGRSAKIITGSGSVKESAGLDLSLQVIAESTVGTDIEGASVTVDEIDEGTSSVAQRDQITISRLPDSGKMQIWPESHSGTMWLEPSVSAYQVKAALDGIEESAFIVSRRTIGESIVFDLMRSDVGVNPSVSVSDTFIGPYGVTMDLDGSYILDVCAAVDLRLPADAILTFTRNGQTQFFQRVRLYPVLLAQGQIV